MVKISLPPPSQSTNPIFKQLLPDKQLLRIYDPTKHNTQALTFRSWGPLSRFDHHDGPEQREYPDKGIHYSGLSLSCCLVETFGDSGVINIKEQRLAFLALKRQLKLLELRENGAMKVGSVAALAQTADREISQAWSRYFYTSYPDIDGIIYYNAHNYEDAIALYERAEDALTCVKDIALSHDDLRPHILKAAEELCLVFE